MDITTSSDIKLQIAVVQSDAAPLELPAVPGLRWLTCARVAESRFEFMEGGRTVSELDFGRARFDLPGLIAIIVVSDAACHRFLNDSWATRFPFVRLDILFVLKADVEAVMAAAMTSLADSLAQQRHLAGQAALDLAGYRREFDRLQMSFARLEAYVSEHFPEKLHVVFECPVGLGDGAAVAAHDYNGDQAVRVQQRLPVNSLGVSGLALSLRARPLGNFPLRVHLHAPENGQTFGTWSIQPDDLPDTGWLQLLLTRAIDVPALSLVVTAEIPATADGLALSIAQPHPYEEFCARIEGGKSLKAPLAFRVFSGLPGVRVPTATSAFTPVDVARPCVAYVPPSVGASVLQFFPPPEGLGSRHVFYDEALESITVHPREGGAVTVGRIHLAVPRDAYRLSARVALQHELARPTEFALLAATADEDVSPTSLLESVGKSIAGFSGWSSLAALEQKRMSVFLPERRQGNMLSLYLLTRQAPDSSPDFAWARFDRFEFDIGSTHVPLPGLRQSTASGDDAERDVSPISVGIAAGV